MNFHFHYEFNFLTVYINFHFLKNKKLNFILFFAYFHMKNNLLLIIQLYLIKNLIVNFTRFTQFYLKVFKLDFLENEIFS